VARAPAKPIASMMEMNDAAIAACAAFFIATRFAT
jgi:hypothetical protein